MLALAAGVLAACSSSPTPSDDPDSYPEDPTVSYQLQVSEPRWIVPGPTIPAGLEVGASNNNLDLIFFEGRLFFVWRTGPSHFASPDVRMHVLSSSDLGNSWTHEHTVAIGADVREPRFLSFGGRLTLHYFEAGTDMFAFEPQHMWRTHRLGPGRWSPPETFGDPGEVPWDLKVRHGKAYLTSYLGNHYDSGIGDVEVRFRFSTDGLRWEPVDPSRPVVYRGGVSEVAFEFEADGTLWAVMRNEDGDTTGFGSQVCRAPATDLAGWECPAHSNPERYDSPEMFRHNGELYLVARRDVGGPFDLGRTDLTFEEQKRENLIAYSARAKRTAVYRLNRQTREIEHLMDLPSAGDTAFPAVVRTGPHTFLLGNYTSPLDDPDRAWLVGQTSSEGTQIYFLTLTFVRK